MVIAYPGVIPKAGGLPGKAALGQDGSRRCCKCYVLIPASRGKSPYCGPCKTDADKAAARARDAKQVDAQGAKSAILSAEHWIGPGFIYGKDGSLILDARTVRALRDEFGGALSALAEHSSLATRAYDARNGQHYHQVLGEVLEQVENLNLTLRHALWPKASGLRPPTDGAKS
ncbi:hypothetical protein [Pedococcus bigeumensis]|uniref:Uncharacterized protein n=1 Tax=Pedococcus bigeumensis TaxID=433644 RepID=A0A502CZ71_9MICO|nr:hypothetical protein [Pedococcus bigeumensis]TPG17051.1 hypothetical protein EAH86_09755 [Pedococcus bigeumensis]